MDCPFRVGLFGGKRGLHEVRAANGFFENKKPAEENAPETAPFLVRWLYAPRHSAETLQQQNLPSHTLQCTNHT